MKQTPEEYANELIEKYRKIQFMCIDEFIPNSTPVLISCAIIDVGNTINYIKTCGDTAEDDLQYFNSVLTILKSKL